MKRKRIHVNNNYLYLKRLNINDNSYFEIEVELTNRADEAPFYEQKDIPKILEILKMLGFNNIFAEDIVD